MRTFLFSLAGLLAGFVAGALAWYLVIMTFSSNVHDKLVEASMTAAFFGGPIGAVVGAAAGWLIARRRQR